MCTENMQLLFIKLNGIRKKVNAMKDNIINRMKQETENLSKEKLSKMSDEEIEDKAKAYKKIRIKEYSAWIIFVACAYILFFCYLLEYILEEGASIGIVVGLGLIAIGVTILFLNFLIRERRKDNKELALAMIKREISPEVVNKTNQTQANIVDTSFIVSKTIDITANGWSSTKLLLDDQNKTFIYQKGKAYSKTYKFSDLINYEVYENGKSRVQGRAGSALIGGAFFGLGGLVVGSSMSRNINEKCNQLKLIIRLNDFDCPQIVITYVDNVDLDKNGWIYRNMKKNIQAVCSMLEYILNEKTLEQSFSVKQEEKTSEKKSSKEQLQELKEMLDEGLITQEDYEQKKKQILGL